MKYFPGFAFTLSFASIMMPVSQTSLFHSPVRTNAYSASSIKFKALSYVSNAWPPHSHHSLLLVTALIFTRSDMNSLVHTLPAASLLTTMYLPPYNVPISVPLSTAMPFTVTSITGAYTSASPFCHLRITVLLVFPS